MSSIKHSLGIAFLTQYAELVIQFVGVMILARLISSEEVGIYSVAAFLMALLHVFRDFGVGKYIIQVDTLTPEKIRSAIGVAYLLGWLMGLLLLASSGALAAFYEEPRIRDILIVMSASFAMTPLGSVLNAVFRRNMEMKKVAAVRITATVCHVVVSIALAAMGYGAMSLAWANFASIVSFGVVAVALRPASTPLMPSFRNLREILSFGSVASLGSLATVGGNNASDVIIGKAISLAATGYFSRANGLINMFRTLVAGAVVPLVLPYFSQVRREKGDMIAPYWLATSHLTGFAWPFFAVMALLALPLVRTLYGPDWDASVPVVQVLCVASAIATLATFAGEVMTAYGHIKTVTQLQLITQPVRVVAILLACPFGLVAVASALVLAEVIALVVTSRFLYATNGVTFRGVVRATGKSALVTVASSLVPLAVMLAWPRGMYPAVELVAGGAGALAGWLIAIVWTGHPIKIHLQQAQAQYWPNAPWAK
ncbi:MAG: oligosaccharide flippase family protein [Pseudomonadota bacterium]